MSSLLTETIEATLEEIGDGDFHRNTTAYVKSKFPTWGTYKLKQIVGNKISIFVEYEKPKVRNRSGLIER